MEFGVPLAVPEKPVGGGEGFRNWELRDAARRAIDGENLSRLGHLSPRDDQPHGDSSVAGSKDFFKLETKLCLESWIRGK